MPQELIPELFSILTKEHLEKLVKLLEAVDPDKIKAILDLIEVENGRIYLKSSS